MILIRGKMEKMAKNKESTGIENMDIILDDTEVNIPVYSLWCIQCKHYENSTKHRVCTAFPKGIPLKIWSDVSNINPHAKPTKEQKNKIVFKNAKSI